MELSAIMIFFGVYFINRRIMAHNKVGRVARMNVFGVMLHRVR